MTAQSCARIRTEGLQKSTKRYPALKRADTYKNLWSGISYMSLIPTNILTDQGPGTYQMSSKSRPERRDHVQQRKENK